MNQSINNGCCSFGILCLALRCLAIVGTVQYRECGLLVQVLVLLLALLLVAVAIAVARDNSFFVSTVLRYEYEYPVD